MQRLNENKLFRVLFSRYGITHKSLDFRMFLDSFSIQ